MPGVLCVLLVGPQEARVRQAMSLLGLDRGSAKHQLDVNDEARLSYVRRHYSRHPEDPTHYHLIIDRYTGASLGYQIAGLGAGVAPLAFASILAAGGSTMTISVLFAATCLIAIACILSLRETATSDLTVDPEAVGTTSAAAER
jgi:hypothetical protein